MKYYPGPGEQVQQSSMPGGFVYDVSAALLLLCLGAFALVAIKACCGSPGAVAGLGALMIFLYY